MSAPVTAAANRGSRWPWLIVGLIVVQMCLALAPPVAALIAGPPAVEPDYYAQAAQWDQRRADQWSLEGRTFDLSIDASAGVVHLALSDRGRPVDGAQITAATFHHANATDRRTVNFAASGAGLYEASWSPDRPGIWEWRLRIELDGRAFFATQLVRLQYGPRLSGADTSNKKGATE